jgi:tRNA(fMet)-specific endonuclease VapC
MESRIICLDTSVLIDFFRKTNKENSYFYQLSAVYESFAVSVITEYEILTGSSPIQQQFWTTFFDKVTILPFLSETSKNAVEIYKALKIKSSLIEVPDILIAATAISKKLPLATINVKHFERIDSLELVRL